MKNDATRTPKNISVAPKAILCEVRVRRLAGRGLAVLNARRAGPNEQDNEYPRTSISSAAGIAIGEVSTATMTAAWQNIRTTPMLIPRPRLSEGIVDVSVIIAARTFVSVRPHREQKLTSSDSISNPHFDNAYPSPPMG